MDKSQYYRAKLPPGQILKVQGQAIRPGTSFHFLLPKNYLDDSEKWTAILCEDDENMIPPLEDK